MLWFRTPDKVYFKKGSLPVALSELKTTLGKKRAFLVTDTFLYEKRLLQARDGQARRDGASSTKPSSTYCPILRWAAHAKASSRCPPSSRT